jgi:hypothetical protein
MSMNATPEFYPAPNPEQLSKQAKAAVVASSELLATLVKTIDPALRTELNRGMENGALVGLQILFGVSGVTPRVMMIAADDDGDNAAVACEVRGGAIALTKAMH